MTHGPPPRRGGRPATGRPVRRPPAARGLFRGPRRGPSHRRRQTCTALDVATRTPRAVASARSAARRSPRSGSASRPASSPRSAGEDTSDQPEIAESAADAHAGAVESLPAGSALLVVKRGPNAGSRFLLDQDVTTAGRHPDSDIFLDDVTVSRRHVEFHREGGGFSVHDVGSLNGTYVNREPVDVATLAGGDEVQIGKFRLVYLTGPRTGEPAAR